MNKHCKYTKYVIRHKWYVFLECLYLWIPFRGLVHDLSKLRLCEWNPYVWFFYGNKENLPKDSLDILCNEKYENDPYYRNWNKMLGSYRTQKTIQDDFDKAWLFHQRANKHHWQWWIVKYDNGGLKCIEMPQVYVKEMVADWRGAGRAITGKDDVIEWYEKNKDKIQLHHNTRKQVEKLVYRSGGK
jgi:hypothetical protein